MSTGAVKWFHTQTGFGLAVPDDDSKDICVHIDAVERAGIGNLREGQKLRNDLETGRHGRASATDLKQV